MIGNMRLTGYGVNCANCGLFFETLVTRAELTRRLYNHLVKDECDAPAPVDYVHYHKVAEYVNANAYVTRTRSAV